MIKKAVGELFALKMLKAMDSVITETQRAALETGTVGYEGSLYEGTPDFKGLLARPAPRLTKEEQSYLDNEVETLCKMLDDWKVQDEIHDIPQEAYEYMKQHRFFGLNIPKEYGGLGFSTMAHSEIVAKISTRCGAAAVTAMVPNSLGPAELILHYGTDEEKNYYLPRLARGEEVPCFALTSPQAGSDATNQKDIGVVFKGEDDKLYIRMNWDKRYTTLAPIATLFGVAFKLKDPDHLLGDKEDLGITLALVPRGLPGMDTSARHRPMGMPFQNGPHWGKDVVVPVDSIIGGRKNAGNGWNMLVDCLSIGRSISLPASATGMVRFATRVTGGYAATRQQFNLQIGKLGAVGEGLARIGGLTYMIDAMRTAPLQDLDLAHDAGESVRPAVASAILKYHATEAARQVIIAAMDIHGGKGVVEGPNNPVASLYKGIPVAITVEGANYLTRALMIFGMGAFMAHPHILDGLAAGRKNSARGAGQFVADFASHAFSNAARSVTYGLTNGYLSPTPVKGPDARFYQHINRLASSFAYTADIMMSYYQAGLQRDERKSALLGDVSANLYIASQVLRRWNYEGRNKEDTPLMQWAATHCLNNAEEALCELVDNLPPHLKAVVRPVVSPRLLVPMPLIDNRRQLRKPSHELDEKVAQIVMTRGAARDRLTAGMFMPKESHEYVARLENAMALAEKSWSHEKAMFRASKDNTKLHAMIPKIVRNLTTAADGAKFHAQRAFETTLESGLNRALNNGIYAGLSATQPEIKEIRRGINHVVFQSKTSTPDECRKMLGDVLDAARNSVLARNPDFNTQLMTSAVRTIRESMEKTVLRAVAAHRDAYTNAMRDSMTKTLGKSVPKDAVKYFMANVGAAVMHNQAPTADDFVKAVERALPAAIDSMTITESEDYGRMVDEAVGKRILTPATGELLRKMNHARSDIIQVDHFPQEWNGKPQQKVCPPAAANNAPKMKGMS